MVTKLLNYVLDTEVENNYLHQGNSILKSLKLLTIFHYIENEYDQP